MSIRHLPQQQSRVETGTVQFGNDWPGVFIRGDAAVYHAMVLRTFIEGGHGVQEDPILLAVLRGLQKLLAGAVVGPAAVMVRIENDGGANECNFPDRSAIAMYLDPWVKCTDRLPDPAEQPRVLIYTAGVDFAGQQVFDVRAETLDECCYADPDDQPEECRAATHWKRITIPQP